MQTVRSVKLQTDLSGFSLSAMTWTVTDRGTERVKGVC